MDVIRLPSISIMIGSFVTFSNTSFELSKYCPGSMYGVMIKSFGIPLFVPGYCTSASLAFFSVCFIFATISGDSHSSPVFFGASVILRILAQPVTSMMLATADHFKKFLLLISGT